MEQNAQLNLDHIMCKSKHGFIKKMKSNKESNKFKVKDLFMIKKDEKNKDIISISIIALLTLVIIFIDSICVLIKGLNKGIIKKEVLSKNSNLGFDLDIIIKS